MSSSYPYLKDTKFLKELDMVQNRSEVVKITALTWAETPITAIEGKILPGGTINIDGNSAIRRTCNLTAIVDEGQGDIEDIRNLFSLNKKVKLEKGIKVDNCGIDFSFYQRYIIDGYLWFPLGLYIIVSASLSHSTSGLSIALQLKDKMCLLNGDVGGILPAAITFDEIIGNRGMKIKGVESNVNIVDGEVVDKTLETNQDNVQQSESESNKNALVISAVQEGEFTEYIIEPTIYQIIQELVNHFGGEPLHKIIISDVDDRLKQVMQWNGDTPLYKITRIQKDKDNTTILTIDEVYKNKAEEQNKINTDVKYNIDYINTGQLVGYINTDFTYPGELVGNAGDSICSILDKIKNTLGNYEYYYDLEGNFVFQEIKNYLNTSKAKVVLTDLQKEDYTVDMSNGKTVYDFVDGKMITSYSNNSQYNMIKNDFIVWGLRKSADGQQLPIRYHLAIDRKPEVGHEYTCVEYIDTQDNLTKYAVPIIYERYMDLPNPGLDGVIYRCKYKDENSTIPFDEKLFFVYDSSKEEYIIQYFEVKTIKTQDWRTELYLTGQQAVPFGTDSNYYFAELNAEWPKLFELVQEEGSTYWIDKLKDDLDPTGLDYFLDFIDSDAEISKYSIDNIGRRSKVISDNSVNCMFYPNIDEFILIETGTKHTQEEVTECKTKGQQYILVTSNIYNGLATGHTYVSAYETVRDLLYQYTNYNESVSIQTLPIFYLEPNVRISIQDSDSNIFGDYMVKTISLPLDATSTMTLSCVRALERI